MKKENIYRIGDFTDDFLWEIGKRLRKIRVSREIKLDTVVAMTGFSETVISKIENGKYKSLKVTLLHILTEFYEIEMSQVIPSKMDIAQNSSAQFS
jgi:transcriptional regulator with XRE-family HTH domain